MSYLNLTDPNVVINLLRQVQGVRYGRLVSNTIIMYDFILTLPDEVTTMWKSRWSLPKLLFYIMRYYTLAASMHFKPLSNKQRSRFVRWELSTAFVSTILAEAILQVRIYALYRQSKWILVIMTSTYGISTAFAAWIFGLDILSAKSSAIVIPGGKTCIFPLLPSNAYAFWIPVLGFESFLCVLVVTRGVITFRSQRIIRRRGQALIDVMVRDSVMIFLALALTYLACLVVWIVEANSYVEIPSGFSVSMACVLGVRMILNLKEAAATRKAVSSSNVIQLSAIATSI